MTAGNPLAGDLAGIGALLARARSEVAAGGLCDLSPLDAKVREVCGAVKGLSARQGREVRVRMLAVYDELGGLADAVRRNLGSIEARLGDTTKRHQATHLSCRPPITPADSLPLDAP